MSNTTVLAMSAASMSMSASARYSSRSAECRIIISEYDGKEATPDDMREYASCVGLIYPNDVANNIVIERVSVVFGFVVLFAVFFLMRKSGDDYVLSALIAFAAAIIANLFVFLFLSGLLYLLS